MISAVEIEIRLRCDTRRRNGLSYVCEMSVHAQSRSSPAAVGKPSVVFVERILPEFVQRNEVSNALPISRQKRRHADASCDAAGLAVRPPTCIAARRLSLR